MKEARDMDNCDLEKLSVSGGELHPGFTPEVTDYTVTVESNVHRVTLDLMTSDCGASYTIVSTVLQTVTSSSETKHKAITSFLHLYHIPALW